jgi:nitroreductase
MISVTDAIKKRTSNFNYDKNRNLDKSIIEELITLATMAPSAFNMQNWRFIAIASDEQKSRLLPIAYNQQKVLDAAVVYIICGTGEQHLSVRKSLKPTHEAGILDADTFEGWVSAAESMYKNNPELQRDEAIRSGALAAATLMLAACGMGLSSTPMIGFNALELSSAFNLSTNEIPVMLVAVGYPDKNPWPQKPRKPIAEVLEII